MKTYIIVGGSRGIGRALLEKLVTANKVINISRVRPDMESPNLTHFAVDVLADEFPDIEGADGLVYCPGSITLKPITSLKTEDFLNDYNINVLGAVKAIKKYYRTLRKSGSGSVVLFSTVAVGAGMPFHSSIASAKGALESLTRSLGAEFAPHVRVNCVAPSVTKTDLAQHLLRNEKMEENAVNRHPLKMIAEAEDVANMAEFLLGDKARAISGQVVGVDAGLSTLRV
jgi:NAD(P)-dependent dehydrogenase (short-subunit alcohol dehydrogenase family)